MTENRLVSTQRLIQGRHKWPRAEYTQEWGYPGGWALMSMLVLIMVIVSQACTYYRTCQIVEYKYIYRHYFNYIKKKRKQSKKSE